MNQSLVVTATRGRKGQGPAQSHRTSFSHVLWVLQVTNFVQLMIGSTGCHSVPVHRERVVHGRQLKIYLPKNADQLDFSRSSSLADTVVLWHKGRLRSRTDVVRQFCHSWYLIVLFFFSGSYPSLSVSQCEHWQGGRLRKWQTLVPGQGNSTKQARATILWSVKTWRPRLKWC